MSDLDKSIGKRIREAREQYGLSQTDVGDRLGLSGVGFGDIERGKNQISVEYLVQLSNLLGRPVEYFLGLDTGLTDQEGELLFIFRSLPDDPARATARAIHLRRDAPPRIAWL